MKPVQPSEHLAKIVGAEPLPRTEVTKKIWAHIKKHKLQSPKNKREILADDKLQPIFGGKKIEAESTHTVVQNLNGITRFVLVQLNSNCLKASARSHL